MGLRQRLVKLALRRPHALLVEVPGWWHTRVEAERAMRQPGWRAALSPAEADVLVVCGRPVSTLVEVVERVWDQLPGPRARVTVAAPQDVGTALDEATARLADERFQRDDALGRTRDEDDQAIGSDQDDQGNHDQGNHDDGDAEMAPEGIALAGNGSDRDGLEMDVLNVPLGPVLPHWPAGLVVRCVLQGDVVVEADVEVLGAAEPSGTSTAIAGPELRAATACDAAARLLDLAGWGDAAASSRRVRDLALDGGVEQAGRELERLAARVSRSRTLRWLLRDLGALGPDQVREHHLPAEASGDVHDRLLAMLERAQKALHGRSGATGDATPAAAALLEALPALVTGLELATVRLVVASHDPDTVGASRRVRADA